MAVQYNPKSYFYTEYGSLADAVAGNLATDAFGPVVGSETTQYRTTAVVRLLSPIQSAKVFAICKGRILIQPMEGDNTKINLILKPEGNDHAPIKIKYFIYRGINKSDLIDNSDSLIAKNISDPLQPKLLQNLWDDYTAYYLPSGTVPSIFPAKRIGYNPIIQTNAMLIDTIFNTFIEGADTYQLPECNKGDYIGNFSGSLGLDIVLDYGDYQLENQEELFKLDLAYARKNEHVLDLGLISASATMTKVDREKRYKEYIHQFIDAAAFWGSHIECGNIKTSNGIILKTNTEIYSNILKKYQTKNNIYVYVKGERGRSYNYYNTSRKLLFDLTNQIPSDSNETYGWPVLIKIYQPNVGQDWIFGVLQYNVDPHILPNRDKHVSINVIAPSVASNLYPIAYSPVVYVTNNFLRPFTLKIHTDPVRTCASFAIINCNLTQVFPEVSYFEDLWYFGIKPPIENNDIEKCSWGYRDSGRMVNTHEFLRNGAQIQDRIFLDGGKVINSVAIKRSLHIATVTSDTNKRFSYQENIHVNNQTFGIVKKASNYSDYILKLYEDNNFSIYKGEFFDSVESVTINSLMLVHEHNINKRNGYFQLGITEAENTIIGQLLPIDAANVYFKLDEINIGISAPYRKFRLGVKFENSTNILLESFPTNDIHIYTLDGFYFFSKDYSSSQEYYKEFSNSLISFRPHSDISNPSNNWKGEYGFDWIRKGDTTLTGDSLAPIDRTYLNNIGHYYSIVGGVKIKDDGGSFDVEKNEIIKFRNLFPIYPTKSNSHLYTGSWIALYPYKNIGGSLSGFPKLTSNGIKKCLTEAVLDLKIEIGSSPSSLKIKFEKEHFQVTSIPPNSTTVLPNDAKYGYLEINNKTVTGGVLRTLTIKIETLIEFSEYKKIEIVAVENNVEKLAGVLWALPNSKANRKELDVTFIDCTTNLDPAISKTGLKGNEKILEDILTKSLNQALIDIKMAASVETLDLRRSVDPVFYTNYSSPYPSPTPNPPTFLSPVEISYLKGKPKFSQGFFDNKLSIFVFGDDCISSAVGSSYNILYGEAEGTGTYIISFLPTLILYASAIANTGSGIPLQRSTISHEAGHGLSLFHSFGNDSEFTFREFITDNILDYIDTSIAPSDSRIGFNKYQLDKLRNNSTLKTEK
ncbi:hypothetical protein [Pedobacter sp. ASV28]|uniref:hypothetical protein n=1 Tax=Pedobacter sp. ASV28 TaxID=2795123 RepID=UPI0018EDEDB1|nr:hypothetical protein [Pedobacter sp. ASV28]